MKPYAKRITAFVTTVAIGASLQWISGIPFQRSPDEAAFAFAIVFGGALMTTYPGFSE